MENISENNFAPVLRRYRLNTYTWLYYYIAPESTYHATSISDVCNVTPTVSDQLITFYGMIYSFQLMILALRIVNAQYSDHLRSSKVSHILHFLFQYGILLGFAYRPTSTSSLCEDNLSLLKLVLNLSTFMSSK